MDSLKALLAAKTANNHHVGSPQEPHKDKLLQTKLREKEIKEALKQQRAGEKAQKEEERLAAAEAARFDRAFHADSKRFAKDERQKQKKEEHEKSGFECEHGVWRCRICHPVTKHK